MIHRVDVAVIGSGFAGSILSWILANQGVKVALIDTAVHPRFAIGESSTPIADMVLRRLAQQYDIPELKALSSWGGWQASHAELGCGRKRGFSYYAHDEGQQFAERQLGERSLLVAASPNDSVADTHWYRPDVDQFLFHRAAVAGAIDLTGMCVVSIDAQDRIRSVVHCQGDGPRRCDVVCEWIIDASGQAGVLARLLGCQDRTGELSTHTHSVYGHYHGVGHWTEYLRRSGYDLSRDPFDPDDAAQHHLVGRGWIWMLRFNNSITSIGYTASTNQSLDWPRQPSIDSVMSDATLVAPLGGPMRTMRLQRMLDPVVGQRSIMLPTAAVTIDPLHSTGIAHALAGIDRIATLLLKSPNVARDAQTYRQSVMAEAHMLDRLVSTAYATIDDFDRFTTACMLYFAGAIRCEERYQQGEVPTQLWNSDDSAFVKFIGDACKLLTQRDHPFFDEIRERLRPWNTAGLMDRDVHNRYAYTFAADGARSTSDP